MSVSVCYHISNITIVACIVLYIVIVSGRVYQIRFSKYHTTIHTKVKPIIPLYLEPFVTANDMTLSSLPLFQFQSKRTQFQDQLLKLNHQLQQLKSHYESVRGDTNDNDNDNNMGDYHASDGIL
jgi:cell shape-determining protein MreC